MKKFTNKKETFFIVVLITVLVSYIAFFGLHVGNFNLKGASEMRFGVDIKGGVEASFVPKDLGRKATEAELEATRTILETRLDQRNILDRDVSIDKDSGSVFVRFPWKSDESNFDPDSAIAELGEMAVLTFQDPDGEIVIEGKHVENASMQADTENTGKYVVKLILKSEGQALFAEATGRLVGQSISIYLDDNMISSPTVEQKIDSNECIINGLESSDEARLLANQINSGALPFALITDNYSTVSPSLGSNALNIMVLSGLIAFILICIALMLYYRVSGIIAALSLLLQISGQILMLTWPQITVTLPGIAGIILSIGMGVDANIIVSERIREEIKSGKSIITAVNSGFKMAFSSIFDGNVTVLIAAFVMMMFGSGAILSFAYTLLFGIIMNFLAGVTATRLMTMSITRMKWLNKTTFFMSNRQMDKKEVKIHPFFQKRKIYFAISGCIIAFGIIMTLINGVQLDIQFKGGTILKYAMSETVALNPDEAASLAEAELPGCIVTAQITTDYATGEKRLVLNTTGSDGISNELLEKVTSALKENYPEQDFELSSTNNVSAYFSKKFLQNGIISIILSMILIIIYIWFSFRKIHGLSAGAMSLLSLSHDLIIVFFTFVIFGIPIGDSFIAVALTILGYSINDTIVIYDRIRENSRTMRGVPIEDMVNKSISQSFTRSLYTNFAVFLSVAIVYIFAVGNGLESVSSFALPMAIGSISGCYSTVCIAGPLWTMWQKHKQKPAVK